MNSCAHRLRTSPNHPRSKSQTQGVANRKPYPAMCSRRKWSRSATLMSTVNAAAAAKGNASNIRFVQIMFGLLRLLPEVMAEITCAGWAPFVRVCPDLLYVLRGERVINMLNHEMSKICVPACKVSESRQRPPMIDEDAGYRFAVTFGDSGVIAFSI